MTEHKEPGIVTEQLELMELHLDVAATIVKDSQRRSLFKPCRLGKLKGCWACKIKRYILRKRFQ